MAILAHNLGLELPVYGPDSAISWTKQDMVAAVSSGEPTFLRRTLLYAPGKYDLNLKSALKIADQTLASYVEVLDVQPTAYSWALYEGECPNDLRGSTFDSGLAQFGLPGFCLIAEVENLGKTCSLPAELQYKFQATLEDYDFHAARKEKGEMAWRIVDMTHLQFRLAQDPVNGDWCTRLVDIEPRLECLK